MEIDLIYRCYYQKSKGDNLSFERLINWITECEKLPGNKFEYNNRSYEWKIINSASLNDIINDDYTDWVYLRALNNSFEAIGHRLDSEKDNLGVKKSIIFSSLWILKSDITKLKVIDNPIKIVNPHIFQTPIHRIDYDFKILVKKLYDSNVKIIRWVEYKNHKTDRIRIR